MKVAGSTSAEKGQCSEDSKVPYVIIVAVVLHVLSFFKALCNIIDGKFNEA